MLDIIQLVFKEEGHKIIRIDGEIPLKERQQRINAFNTDRSYFCFLLSTKVGGFGLNLTSADRVIICKFNFLAGTRQIWPKLF